MLVHFMKGSLPWQAKDSGETKEQKNARIGKLKAEMKWEVICEGLPAVFASFLMVSQCLDFEEKPDYKLLHKFIEVSAQREGLTLDGVYDWTQRRQDGEVVEHTDEDDRLSCNLSQVSMDSAGDGNRQLGMANRSGTYTAGDTSSSGSTQAGAARAGATGAGVGPLMRVAKKGTDTTEEKAAANLMRAMQSAGVENSGQFWQTMKKMGVAGKDEEGKEKAPSEQDSDAKEGADASPAQGS
mmetsp:Transcript_140004/g.435437  ORF Transcript_140004/g.435437 Transcript_140004/m.435437 type:complete len:240 (+) Transcript_140004:692-1411(+)